MQLSTQACPSCGAEIPVESGYVTWCEHCSWNVVAPDPVVPRGRFERVYAAAGKRLGARLAAELLEAETLEPRLTPARAAAYMIAAGVHLITLAFLATGALVAVSALPNVFGILMGLLIASPGFLMLPRLGKVSKDARTIGREVAPALFGLIDEVAAALGTKSANVLVVDADFNAMWGVVGWRRRRVLSLGLPLITALEPQERVAVVAHEFAHARNGDASRGVVVGGALGSLFELYVLIRPEGRPVGLEAIFNVFFALIATPVWWLIQLEFHLLRRDAQRAEYLADALAADVSGSGAVVSLHEKLLLHPTMRGVVQHATRASAQDLFASLESAVRSVPERERERRRRVARLEDSRLGDSHPPTAMRIALVEGRPPAAGRVHLDPERSAAIDRELAPLRPELQRELIDDYRARVHHR